MTQKSADTLSKALESYLYANIHLNVYIHIYIYTLSLSLSVTLVLSLSVSLSHSLSFPGVALDSLSVSTCRQKTMTMGNRRKALVVSSLSLFLSLSLALSLCLSLSLSLCLSFSLYLFLSLTLFLSQVWLCVLYWFLLVGKKTIAMGNRRKALVVSSPSLSLPLSLSLSLSLSLTLNKFGSADPEPYYFGGADAVYSSMRSPETGTLSNTQ